MVTVKVLSIKEKYQRVLYQPDLRKSHISTTASDSLNTSLTIGVRNIRLPEFSNSRKVEGYNCRIFDSTACQYDMILGQNFMRHIGIQITFLPTAFDGSIGW